MNSSLLGVSFIDQNNKEIPVYSTGIVTIYIPMASTNRDMTHKCVYYSTIENDFVNSGCSEGEIMNNTFSCRCTHLTDFGILGLPRTEESKSPSINIPSNKDKLIKVFV